MVQMRWLGYRTLYKLMLSLHTPQKVKLKKLSLAQDDQVS